jgi:hypothetical protein
MTSWDVCSSLIETFINRLPSIDEGIDILKEDIKVINNQIGTSLLNKENFTQEYKRFENWLMQSLQSSPIPEEITAVYFGLFESTENRLQIYFCGSDEWDSEDPDWACDPIYYPQEPYPNLPLCQEMHSVLKQDVYAGVYLSLGIMVLLVIQFCRSHGSVLLAGRKHLYLATGFDDGDLYNIGVLTSSGLKKKI